MLKTCHSSLARDGLLQALAASSLEVRVRSGLALLALTDKHPELMVPPPVMLEVVERELALAQPQDDRRVRETSSTCSRWPSSANRCACGSGVRFRRCVPARHALEYLETVLAPRIFAALAPRLTVAIGRGPHKRGAAAARAELLDAAMVGLSRHELRGKWPPAMATPKV